LTREEFLKKQIKAQGYTVKSFAHHINMPYSSLLSMLNDEKLGKAAVDSVIRICQALNISVEELQEITIGFENAPSRLILSPHEEKVIQRYREKTDLQHAINILLDIE